MWALRQGDERTEACENEKGGSAPGNWGPHPRERVWSPTSTPTLSHPFPVLPHLRGPRAAPATRVQNRRHMDSQPATRLPALLGRLLVLTEGSTHSAA